MAAAITTDLVKGFGYTHSNKPTEDPREVADMAVKAQMAITKATKDGIERGADVIKSLSPEFASVLNRWMQFGPLNQLTQQLSQVLTAELGRDITLTSPLSTGFVPYDLVAPSRLLYPVYTPLRNKLPRTQGQGTSRRAKLFTGIAGSGTGVGAVAIDIPELPGGGSSIPGTSWPMNLPNSAGHNAVDLNVSYKFFGLTEPISWLAQFSGQGFEDIAALANLLLLQKFMLAEEYMIFSGCASALTTPGAPTVVTRTAGTGETAQTGITNGQNIYVAVTATNSFGETVASSSTSAVWATGDVTDVTIATVKGALSYNIYVTTGTAPGTFHLQLSGVGGNKVTLQGALATTTATPPTADTGTGATTRYDGLFSILSGKASSTYTQGNGYYLPNAQQTASVSLFNTALYSMWQQTKADPAEIIMEGSDVKRLSDDLRTNTSTNYRLFIGQSEVPGMIAGTAVSEFVNPVTRKMIPILVHPWFPQGNAVIKTYTLPFPWTNVSNVTEIVNVQDYMSISWPVIDVTFRYSMFLYGAMVHYAPVYDGLVQGLQVSATNPWS